jgi:hypothetical protein
VVQLRRTVNGALAGAAAAGVWAAQQPLDKRVFGCGYDDVELLGKLITRGSGWPVAGVGFHVLNGAAFGAVFALVRPLIPAPALVAGVAAAIGEHVALWPLGALVDRHHPARADLERMGGNRRAFAQAGWRHLLFGVVLAELERRLNSSQFEPLEQVPVSSNGHGDIERATVGTTEA